MEYIIGGVCSIILFIAGLFTKQFLPSYMKHKGKNLATKEDVEEITRLTESTKTELQKELESHKRSLNIEIEELKLQQNKLFTNFELFTAKKHECYPELFKLIEKCNGAVRGLRGSQRRINFENVNEQDIALFMEDRFFTSSDTERILSLWNNERGEAITLLNRRLERINYNEAEEKYYEASDYHFYNILFLSEDVEIMARDSLKKIHTLWTNYDPDYGGLIGDYVTENELLIEQIDRLRSELKLKMREELFPS